MNSPQDIWKAALRGMAEQTLPKCETPGCTAFSLQGAAEALLGGNVRCARCNRRSCQQHYLLTPTAPPRAICVDCVCEERGKERPDTKPPPQAPSQSSGHGKVIDAQFVEVNEDKKQRRKS